MKEDVYMNLFSLLFILLILAIILLIPTGIIALIVILIIKSQKRQQPPSQNYTPPQYNQPNPTGHIPQYVDPTQTNNMNQGCNSPPQMNPQMQSKYNSYIPDQVNNPSATNNIEQGYVPPQHYSVPKGIPKKPPKKKLSSSEIMLLIGTTFIVLAGIGFAVANWVHASYMGRVIIMTLATLISFGISVIFKKAVKLNNTSIAFYGMGAVFASITFITAGYYEFFGSWLSCSGDGFGLLYALGSLITAIIALIAYKIYKNTPFAYIGLSFTSIAIIFLLIQIGQGIPSSVAFSFMAVQAIMTACVHTFKINEKTSIARPIRIVSDITSVFFIFFSCIRILMDTTEQPILNYLALIIFIAQLIYYGIVKKKSGFLGLQSVISTYTFFCFCGIMADTSAILTMGTLMILLHCVNRFIPQIKNKFSEGFTLLGAGVMTILNINLATEQEGIITFLGFAIAITTSLLFSSYVILAKDRVIRNFAGLMSPVIPLMITAGINGMLDFGYATDYVIAYGLLSAILLAVTYAFIIIPKQRPAIANKFESKTILYSNMTVIGILLLQMIEGEISVPMLCVAILAVIHYLLSNLLKNNLTSILSAFTLTGLITAILDTPKIPSLTRYILFMILFIGIMALSRIYQKDAIFIKKDGLLSFKIDSIMMASWLFVTKIFDGKYGTFFGFIALAILVLNSIRKKTSTGSKARILTVSTFFMVLALINRPFLIPYSTIININIIIGIFALAGVALRYIWNSYPKQIKCFLNVYYKILYGILICYAFCIATLSNTIFVLIITTAILIASAMMKKKSWFTTSCIALITITLLATRDYLMMMSWWIYLFIVGFILILLAGANEYFKQHGESLKSKVAKFFSKWD